MHAQLTQGVGCDQDTCRLGSQRSVKRPASYVSGYLQSLRKVFCVADCDIMVGIADSVCEVNEGRKPYIILYCTYFS